MTCIMLLQEVPNLAQCAALAVNFFSLEPKRPNFHS